MILWQPYWTRIGTKMESSGQPLLTLENFNYICDEILQNVDARVGAPGASFCAFLKNRRGLVYRNYVNHKDAAKAGYMQNPNGLLDRHKCGAVFIHASLNQSGVDDSKLGKVHAAIGMGLLVLKLFINSTSKSYYDPAMSAYVDANGFKFPQCRCDKGVYKHNWALGIYYDYKEGKLSVLSLANALFMIEAYNRQAAGLPN